MSTIIACLLSLGFLRCLERVRSLGRARRLAHSHLVRAFPILPHARGCEAAAEEVEMVELGFWHLDGEEKVLGKFGHMEVLGI